MKIKTADFVLSANSPSHYPGEGLPEIAFAGRSNVGKSSLINKLVNRKALAKTSGKPGHTRMINFFRVNNRYMFVDLPGYGFAKVAKTERHKWKEMVETYFLASPELRAVVLITDIRRKPGVEEKDLIGFLTAEGITPVLVITKADKLGKTKRVKPLREIGKEFGIPHTNLLVFSSHTGEGRDRLWSKIVDLLDQL
jgi:GTP-binding protein